MYLFREKSIVLKILSEIVCSNGNVIIINNNLSLIEDENIVCSLIFLSDTSESIFRKMISKSLIFLETNG